MSLNGWRALRGVVGVGQAQATIVGSVQTDMLSSNLPIAITPCFVSP